VLEDVPRHFFPGAVPQEDGMIIKGLRVTTTSFSHFLKVFALGEPPLFSRPSVPEGGIPKRYLGILKPEIGEVDTVVDLAIGNGTDPVEKAFSREEINTLFDLFDVFPWKEEPVDRREMLRLLECIFEQYSAVNNFLVGTPTPSRVVEAQRAMADILRNINRLKGL
jgi:hypothetical protein